MPPHGPDPGPERPPMAEGPRYDPSMTDGASDAYFQVTVEATAVPTLITATGELDAASSAELGRALDAALEAGSGATLDLGGITFIDSSGLRVVTLGVRRAQDEDQPFTVVAASAAVRRILDITGVGELLAP